MSNVHIVVVWISYEVGKLFFFFFVMFAVEFYRLLVFDKCPTFSKCMWSVEILSHLLVQPQFIMLGCTQFKCTEDQTILQIKEYYLCNLDV